MAEQDVWCKRCFNSFQSTDCVALGSRFVTLASHTVAWRGGKPMNTTSMSRRHVMSRLCKTTRHIRHIDLCDGSAGKDLAQNCGESALVWVPSSECCLHLLALEMQMTYLYLFISIYHIWVRTHCTPLIVSANLNLVKFSLLFNSRRAYLHAATWRGTSLILNTTWTSQRD